MDTREAVDIFVGSINAGDADAISACLAEDHVFIDSLGNRVAGRIAVVAGWRGYLSMFPDYRLDVDRIMCVEREALLCGTASGTLHRDGVQMEGGAVRLHAAWRAVAEMGKIALWQVYADNKPVYDLLGRPG